MEILFISNKEKQSMTKAEIIEKVKFVLNGQNPNYSELKIKLYLDFFEKEHEILFVNLPSLSSEPQMKVITEIVNELINYSISNKEWLKEKIWIHYNECIENTSYGEVPDEGFENEVEANRAYFKIYNSEEAYKAARLDEILIDIDFTDNRHFNLGYSCPWEDEHGLRILVENGKFNGME